MPGSTVEMQTKITNEGTGASEIHTRAGYFLSQDEVWDNGDIILSSDDEELKRIYMQWQDQKNALAIYYSMSKAELNEQKVDLTKLEREANDTEKKLSLKSTAFQKDFIDNPIQHDVLLHLDFIA